MDAKRNRTLISIEKRLEEDENDYNAWFYKCITLSGEKRYREAIDAGHKCLEILSTLDNVMADLAGEMNYYGLIYYHLGYCWVRLNDGNKAYAAYRKGFDIWPDDLDLNYALAEVGHFSKEDEILMYHGNKYLEAVDKYKEELNPDLKSFANPVKVRELTLSTRHVLHAKDMHRKNVEGWLAGISSSGSI